MPELRPQLSWSDVSREDDVPPVTLTITLRRLVHNSAAAWDLFPGHHDRDYARVNGHADVFANTSLLLAVADRMITDWAGPRTRIMRRSLTVALPVHPGDTLQASGVVTEHRRDGELHVVDIRTELSTARGRCAHGVTSIVLPGQP
jgi:acyl dehydratase